MNQKSSRRHFLKGAVGSLGGIIATRVVGLFPEAQATLADAGRENVPITQTITTAQLDVGELYAGFLLLPENALMPSFVQCAPAPILCQVENDQDPNVVAYRGETLWFDSVDDLSSNLPFSTYAPTSLPQNIEFMQGYIIRFVQDGNIFVARFDYGTADNLQPLISLSAQPLYPRPYPVWPIHMNYDNQKQASSEEGVAISPEKVNFTVTPGLMLPTRYGHVIHWISQNVLYTLTVEHDPQRNAALEITKSLVEIQ